MYVCVCGHANFQGAPLSPSLSLSLSLSLYSFIPKVLEYREQLLTFTCITWNVIFLVLQTSKDDNRIYLSIYLMRVRTPVCVCVHAPFVIISWKWVPFFVSLLIPKPTLTYHTHILCLSPNMYHVFSIIARNLLGRGGIYSTHLTPIFLFIATTIYENIFRPTPAIEAFLIMSTLGLHHWCML